jgi:hypothetical protein
MRMNRPIPIPLSLLPLLFCGCMDLMALGSAPRTQPAENTTPAPKQDCPPTEQEVVVGKVMNEAFAKGWMGCRIRTSAKFLSPDGSIAAAQFAIPPDSMLFLASDPAAGDAPSTIYVVVKKAQADAVFSLKKGDTIRLVGTPQSNPKLPMLRQYYFAAETLEPVKP